MEDQSDTPIITAEMVHNWRINYGLDVRSPRQAAAWWSEQYQGFAPAGAVAALGLCLEKITTATRERDEARAIANDRDAMVDHRDRALTAMYQCVDVITQERDEARAKVERLRKVLHRLACLGNGDQYGTSFGNDIAREVLAATEAKP